MVIEKGAPSLRRWLAGAHHVLGNRGLGQHESQFEEFSMDPRRSPKGIGQAHPANELTSLFRQFRPSRLSMAAFPAPVQPESLAMPSDHGLRFDDDECRAPTRPKPPQTRPEEPVRRPQANTPLLRPAQHIDLMAKGDDLQ